MQPVSVNKLICGILFDPSFSLLDSWGKIADTILYKKNPYFDPEYFPQISGQYTLARYLDNPKKGHRLDLNSENIIYTHTIEKDFEAEYTQFVDSITKYLVPHVIEKYGLTVRRIGIIYVSQMDDNALNSFMAKYFTPEMTEIIDCRFSKRAPVPTEISLTGNDNYINKIYSVGTLNDEIKGVSFDYQLYFSPPLLNIKPRLAKFFEASKTSFFDEVYREEYCAEE